MHYSCAYFIDRNDSLEQARLNKCRHIAARLLLKPGQRVLDIGCGWGSMAFYLAQNFDVKVTGITLSKERLAKQPDIVQPTRDYLHTDFQAGRTHSDAAREI